MRSCLIIFTLSALLCTGCKEANKSEALSGPAAYSRAVPSAQQKPNPIKIHPVEHATAVLEWNGLAVYVDPVGGAQAFSAYPKPDLILITDIHGDHFNAETLEGLDTDDAKIILPQAVADQMP